MSFSKVEAGRGLTWLTEGIRLVIANPMPFLVMGLILAVINFIPILGGLVLTICGPALIGGIVYAAREQAEGSKAEIAHLFRAFQEPGKIGPMLLLCLPAIVGGAVLLILGLMFGLGALIGGGLSASSGATEGIAGAIGGGFLVLLLVAVTLMFLIYALQFFAVPRVMLDGIEPFAAMRESLGACIANIGAFLVFAIVLFVAFIVLAFVLMLVPIIGWIALVAAASVVFATAEYFAWKQVFGTEANRVLPPAPAQS
jgi:hypothetical protein